MSLDVKVLSFNIGTGAPGTTVTVTVGFETKAAILFWSGHTSASDGSGAADVVRGIGFIANRSGTIDVAAVGSWSQTGQGNAVADKGHDTNNCILQMGNAAPVAAADVQSISSTQVVFEISSGGSFGAFTVDLRVTGIFLGGSDIAGEIVDFAASGTAPVDQEVATTDVPQVILAINARLVTMGSDAVDSDLCLGVGRSSSEHFCWAGASNDNSGSMITESYLREGDISIGYAAAKGSIEQQASLVSLTRTGGNGFTINWASKALNTQHSVLVLSGTFQSKIGSFLTQTDTTTDMTGTTTFTPKALLFVSHNKAANSSAGLSAHDKFSIGVATGTSEQHAQAMADRDGDSTSFGSVALEQDHIYVNLDEVNQTKQGAANLTALSSTGFTARMTDADPAQAFVGWLALGDAAAGGVEGDLAATESADTAALDGSVLVVGDLAGTEAADAAALTGDVLVQGDLAGTEAADTLTASGTVSDVASGDLAATEAPDVAALDGDVIVAGDLAASDGSDAASVDVSVLIAGLLSVIEATDTTALSGDVLVQGSADATESPDMFAASGEVADAGIDGDVAVAEGSDSLAAVGDVLVTGDLAVSEGSDTAAFTGGVVVAGALSANDDGDTVAAAGDVLVAGDVLLAEAEDVSAVAGAVLIAGDAAAVEGQDVAAFSGSGLTTGTLDATEEPDTASSSGRVIVAGTWIVAEAPDVAGAEGQVIVAGSLVGADSPDVAALIGAVVVAGNLAAIEGLDVFVGASAENPSDPRILEVAGSSVLRTFAITATGSVRTIAVTGTASLRTTNVTARRED
jgi:hypothetical protein